MSETNFNAFLLDQVKPILWFFSAMTERSLLLTGISTQLITSPVTLLRSETILASNVTDYLSATMKGSSKMKDCKCLL